MTARAWISSGVLTVAMASMEKASAKGLEKDPN